MAAVDTARDERDDFALTSFTTWGILIVRMALLLVFGMALGLHRPGVLRGEDAAERKTFPLVIHANPDAPWGGDIENVEKVFHSAAEPLWQYFPGRELKPIVVEPKGGPIVLFEPGPKGEFQVRLNTGDRLWAQQAYQFSHELCHILCHYKPGPNRNLWFEESVCEAASLFALRRMSEAWQTAPPYPNWKNYSTSLAGYAADRLKNGNLPPGQTLAGWYQDHADQLASDGVNRDHNQIVATSLLVQFEKQPKHWGAVQYLNGPGPRVAESFTVYLDGWHQRCLPEHQEFVAGIARQFEITIPVEPNPVRDQIKAKYEREIEDLTARIQELRKKRDTELRELFEQDQKRRKNVPPLQ